ncbi:hypothetical protein NP493_4462g00001 [Ridgeia piscesae]|uniref:Uncharacterized protein n=1 Tax=Ridgeia piscesae TaxID=27915 RepID=A0AAD9IZM6_RIDPI|nr:hypothetical protein NP493_4462g00001 [Ridgeia piscesae]
MPAGRPAKRVAPAVRPPSARRAALTRPTEPDLPAPPVRRRRIASAAAGRPDDLPKDTASTASMVAIVTREVLKQLREDRDAALPPPSLPAPVLPATRPPGFTRVQTQSHRNFYLGASDVASAQCSSDRGHTACL